MLKVEANTLEEAYTQASSELECSITQLHFEIIQHPKSGFLGFFKKSAIIVATCKKKSAPYHKNKETPERSNHYKPQKKSFQNEEKKETIQTPTSPKESIVTQKYSSEESDIFDSFYDEQHIKSNSQVVDEISSSVKKLFSTICFDLDKIEVSMLDSDTVFINIQGKDAALLIGKEGYRYKAISYMLFNWINAKYNLSTRLEIAEFLNSQEKMIANYIKPVIAQIEQNGKGNTKPLDGILVQIALKQLRERFPDKYVGIKSNNFDEKYIIVNEFKK